MNENNIFILGNIIKKDNIESEIKKKIYMSYKNNFQQIKDTTLISDIGWGCTLRSTQMLLANCLLEHNLNKDFNVFENNIISKEYIDIISLFLDNHLSYLSIHNIVNGPIKSTIIPGNWYGPNTAMYIISKLFNNIKNTNINNNLNLIFEENRVIYYHKYMKLLDNKSILIILPMRLGINNLNESYLNQLIILIKQKQFMGMVGGVKNMSYYFLGVEENNNNLIYLDPHYVQEYNLENDIKNVYHTNKYGKINIDKINPTLAIGFYCRDLHSYIELCYNIKSLLDYDEPIININYSKNQNNDDVYNISDEGVIININNNDWELL